MPTAEQRERTLERFRRHREAWDANPALRTLYAEWYGRIGAALPPPELGPRIELGSGPGFARGFIPGLELTDVVAAPWHDRELSADAHRRAPTPASARWCCSTCSTTCRRRAGSLRRRRACCGPSGRIVLCEPLHQPAVLPGLQVPARGAGRSVGRSAGAGRPPGVRADERSVRFQPGHSDGAVRARPRGVRARVSVAEDRSVQRLAGPSYPASGGFSRGALLPGLIWRALHRLERRLPEVDVPLDRLSAAGRHRKNVIHDGVSDSGRDVSGPENSWSADSEIAPGALHWARDWISCVCVFAAQAASNLTRSRP